MTYQEELKEKLTNRLMKTISQLPGFCKQYFVGKDTSTTIKTKVAYADDLKVFFNYISAIKPVNTLKDLDTITSEDIENFLFYLKNSDKNDKKRKLMTLRSLYNYFYKKREILTNPAVIVDVPIVLKKKTIYLEREEAKNLLKVTKAENNISRNRDYAITALFIATGMRISELVSLNLSDVDLINNTLSVFRAKNGGEAIINFSNEVNKILTKYIEQRAEIDILPEDKDALFISRERKRIGVGGVANIIKRNAKGISTKHITPHKLRATYATNLYNETGDIYLVADRLGHRNVNTTKEYYAVIDNKKSKEAVKHSII